VLPWYQQQRFRFAGAALLAGLGIGGLVTLALGYQSSPHAAIPERSAFDAIGSDRAAVATATATARPKASARPAKKPKQTKAGVPVSSAGTAEPTATSTPDDEELGNSPASTPAPARSAPRRQTVVTTPRTQLKPVTKKTPAKPAPTPRPTTTAPTPAPTAAAPQPAATATPNPPHRPPYPHPGGGDDDDPGTP
jgi:outer membrane biosynthesis protein TonB